MSASLPCMSWNSPIDWLNCLRSCAYGITTSSAAAISPPADRQRAPRARNRARSSALLTPLPTSFQHVFGRHDAILKHQLAGVAAAHASLSSFCAVKARKAFSMMNAVMPRGPRPGSVLA